MPITLPEHLGDFAMAVALGAIRNTNGGTYKAFERFMHRDVIGTTREGMWNGAGDLYFPTSPVPIRIRAGGDIADDAAGAGARAVKIIGIDSNLKLAEETIATNGVSASLASGTSWWRVNEVQVAGVGTYGGGNVGKMELETTGGTLWLTIDIDEGITHHGAISTPNDHTGILTGAVIQVEAGKDVNLVISARPSYDTVIAPFAPAFVIRTFGNISQGIESLPFVNPRILPPASDIWFDAFVDASTSSASILMEYRLVPS